MNSYRIPELQTGINRIVNDLQPGKIHVRGETQLAGFPTTGLEVIKLFSSSAQLSMKFQPLINVEIVKYCGKFRFKTQKLVIYPAHKC